MGRDDAAELEALFRAMPDLLFVVDPNGVFVRCRAGRTEDLYLAPEDFIGKRVAEVLPAPIAQLLDDACARVSGGEPMVRFEYELMMASRKHFEARVVPVDGGNFIVVTRDVTDLRRIEEERRQLDRKVQEAQRLESLGVLAGGIAHDFNNLLAAVLGGAELIARHVPPGSRMEEPLEIVQQSAWRASELSRQLLAYAGKATTETRSIDLGALVRDTAQLLDSALSKRARLTLALEEGAPPVRGDLAQLRQVVLNLITNASDAVAERGGTVTLRTRVAQHGDPPTAYLELSVADDGCGMDETTRARMFEPFFTTKGLGRGLGLASVLGIVRAHGGCIEVDSRPGVGTLARVLLPASDEQPEPAPPPAAERDPLPIANATALVVDDEAGLRDVVRGLLEAAGLSVLTAGDGQAALELYARHPNIDVVVLDVTMPKLGGPETFLALRRLRADLPVILASGYDERNARLQLRDANPPPLFLEKPFESATLLAAIAEALAQPR